jgi:hypothetical protein
LALNISLPYACLLLLYERSLPRWNTFVEPSVACSAVIDHRRLSWPAMSFSAPGFWRVRSRQKGGILLHFI